MSKHRPLTKRLAVLFVSIAVVCALWLPSAFQHSSSASGIPHKVYVAFGLHVNLYHSFRGDTNDENGFGQDIRVIRHTLSELDRLNRKRIPVSAAWEFDNLFSLQEILPVHAPDIIRGVQRRVNQNQDEVLLMSYNNGLLPAMNHEEFTVSVQRAVSNENGCGVRDLFGRATPVVRPQEMMTTPGHFERYTELGIPYIALYYSATPFDAFRLFARELTQVEAYNPLAYRNPETGEQAVIVPTYHVGDLVEHVSLRNWAQNLHQLQVEGKIDRDVLIFLNFDADAEFWSGIDLPWYLEWLPNTGGLTQLVESVAGLDFVAFTKLGDYLAAHPPAGSIHFSQDTADGSFHGYHSWAEKAFASDYWTRTLRNRGAHEMAKRVIALSATDDMPPDIQAVLRASFETRLRVLSTTNFGLGGPFLARQREAAMAALLERLDRYTSKIHEKLTAVIDDLLQKAIPPAIDASRGSLMGKFLNINRDLTGSEAGDRILSLDLTGKESIGSRYFITDARGREIPATLVERPREPDNTSQSIRLRVSKSHDMPDGPYFLYRRTRGPFGPVSTTSTLFADRRILRNEHIGVHFNDNGTITKVVKDGVVQLDGESLVPYIRYRGERLGPEKLTLSVEEPGDNEVASVRLHGVWDGPPGATRAPGYVDYRFRLLRGVPYLFIEGEVRYPDTYRHTVMQPEKPMLARKIDAGWEEVAPLELHFAPRASREHPFLIQKRNYLGKEDAYAVDYFRHSPKNLNVASINNHITAEYAGVTNGRQGMAVAMNTDVNANFAFCPFKLEHVDESDEFRIRANPFGTYQGEQLRSPTRGNRLGYDAVLLSAPQFHSAAPTYNGYSERFDLMVAFFDAGTIPREVKQDLISFARPPLARVAGQVENAVVEVPAPLPPDGLLALPYKDGILFHWEHAGPPGTNYRLRCSASPGGQVRSFIVEKTTLFVESTRLPALRTAGALYGVVAEVLDSDGRTATRSREIFFRFTPQADSDLNIPAELKARILWSNISAWLSRRLL